MYSLSVLVRACAVIALVVGLGGFTKASSAYALISLEIATDFPRPSLNDRRDIEFSGSVSDGSSTAQGYANLNTGILRASATSYGSQGPLAHAQAVIEDTFRFSAGASGTAFLDWSIDGDVSALFSNSPDYHFGKGLLSFYLFLPDSTVQQLLYVFSSNNQVCEAHLTETSCAVGNSFSASGSIEVPIATGWNYFVQVGLTTQARGGTANFGNTTHLYLRAPDGVSIDSDSGTFLAAAAPISFVSAPATGSLVAVAVGLAALVRRRASHV